VEIFMSFKTILAKVRSMSWLTFLCIITAYFTLILNIPILRHYCNILESLDQFSIWFAISIPFVLFALLLIIFTIFSFKYIAKPIFFILLTTSGIVFYASLKYNLIFDSDMIRNFFESNTREALTYFNAESLIISLSSGLLPAIAMCFIKIKYPKTIIQGFFKRIGVMVVALAFVGIVAAFQYQSYAAVGRNNSSLNHEIIPASFVHATYKYLKETYFTEPLVFKDLDPNAKIDNPDERPEIMVIIVGETARSANFPEEGYSKNTTPFTDGLQNLVFYRKVKSCGTCTAVSVPCMFSNMKREDYDHDKAYYSSSLVDILNTSGYGEVWIDNDGGCKGTCDRIKNIKIEPADEKSDLCTSESCYDSILIEKMKQAINSMKTEHKVIYLHLIGSHGPTYYQRVPAEFKKFTPSCERSDIQNCTKEELVNAYDNTIYYTDYFIRSVADTLKEYEPQYGVGLFYVSDHGESLGEYNVYLHGAPYAIAPEYQTHVPMASWFSDGFIKDHKLNLTCMKKKAINDEYSHDNFFHSILGIMDVKTSVYDASLDIFNSCRE
jgi:lipid A ethanolaminephosphotransferase